MALFTSAVYQNEFLPDGGTDVNAIITIACSGAGAAGQTGSGDAGEIIIVDTSGSMGDRNMQAAKQAAMVALDHILDGTYFAVVPGTTRRTWHTRWCNRGPAWCAWTGAPGPRPGGRSVTSGPMAAPRWATG